MGIGEQNIFGMKVFKICTKLTLNYRIQFYVQVGLTWPLWCRVLVSEQQRRGRPLRLQRLPQLSPHEEPQLRHGQY